MIASEGIIGAEADCGMGEEMKTTVAAFVVILILASTLLIALDIQTVMAEPRT